MASVEPAPEKSPHQGAARPHRQHRQASRRKSHKQPLLESPGLALWAVILSLMAGGLLLILWQTSLGTAALGHMALLSLLTLLLFGLDKWQAIKGKRRVSELNLLLFSLAGGALGGILGMLIFRHKLRRKSFRLLLPAALFLHVALTLILTFKT